jgi:hypothetical protein
VLWFLLVLGVARLDHGIRLCAASALAESRLIQEALEREVTPPRNGTYEMAEVSPANARLGAVRSLSAVMCRLLGRFGCLPLVVMGGCGADTITVLAPTTRSRP